MACDTTRQTIQNKNFGTVRGNLILKNNRRRAVTADAHFPHSHGPNGSDVSV